MIVKRQKKFTFASDQAKKDLIDFLKYQSLDHSKLDPKELEIFRKGLDAIGDQSELGNKENIPEGFDDTLRKIGIPESAIKQVEHWHYQQGPEVQERYKRILAARSGKTLTGAEKHVYDRAVQDYRYSYNTGMNKTKEAGSKKFTKEDYQKKEREI